MTIGRRSFSLAMAGAAVVEHTGFWGSACNGAPASKRLHRECCGGWVDYMEASGFDVNVIEVADVARVVSAQEYPSRCARATTPKSKAIQSKVMCSRLLSAGCCASDPMG